MNHEQTVSLSVTMLSFTATAALLGLCALVRADVNATNPTSGVVPLPIHSHNDELQAIPLYGALSNGLSSIEADTWWLNNTLFVGHVDTNLTANATLQSVYLDPLLSMLNQLNPSLQPGERPKDIFIDYPDTTLQLLIDLKSDGNTSFQPIIDALAPLRDAGYLTTYTNGTLTPSAIQVVGSGNTDFSLVQASDPRIMFYDAPLNELNATAAYQPDVAPTASADFDADFFWFGILPLDPIRRAVIDSWIDGAKARGIKSRFYDTIGDPVQWRDNVWEELLNDGEYWLNADDLSAAATFWKAWNASRTDTSSS